MSASATGHEKNAVLMLSVSGLRGIVGQSLTPEVAARFGEAVGSWLASEKKHDKPPHVVVGRDSRGSGTMIELAAVAGLISTGCKVTTLGIVTTPGVAVMVGQLGAQAGLVITASHNPIQWNGIKIINEQGVAPPASQAKLIVERFRSAETSPPTRVTVPELQPLSHDETTARTHVDRLLPLLDVQAIRARKIKAVLHSVHGAGGPETALLLRELGVEFVHLYAEPTGKFPHPPEPVREHLGSLCDAVLQNGADVGFAQDPDADRLALVDEKGQYPGEEYTLALTAGHLLDRQALTGKRDSVVVANLSTSRMIDDVAARHGARVVRTPVGEAHVAAALMRENALMGGEGNGGVIWPAVCKVRDSLAGVGLILEMLAGSTQPLSKIAASIPSYTIVKEKFDIKPGLSERVPAAMREKFAGQRIDLQDGVRVDWADRWVSVRASNTEPILRIIAEARDEAAARELIAQAQSAMGL